MKPKELTDTQLVEYILTQDQELFVELVNRYQNKLYRYALGMVGNSAEAKDVVQETFIKAYKNLRAFKNKYKFSSWLYRIAHNQAIDQLRGFKKFLQLPDLDWLALEGNRQPEEILEEKELSNQLQKNLAKLPLKYREVLTLFYLQEKSYKEISEILRLPKNTVGVRLARAKRALKKIYEKRT